MQFNSFYLSSNHGLKTVDILVHSMLCIPRFSYYSQNFLIQVRTLICLDISDDIQSPDNVQYIYTVFVLLKLLLCLCAVLTCCHRSYQTNVRTTYHGSIWPLLPMATCWHSLMKEVTCGWGLRILRYSCNTSSTVK